MGVVDFLRMVNKYGRPAYESATGNDSGGSSGGGDEEQAPAQAPSQTPQRQQSQSPFQIPIGDPGIGGVTGTIDPRRLGGGYYPSNYDPYAGVSDAPTPALDKYQHDISSYPDRPTPSWMRTIGTGALSFANAQKPDQVTEHIDKFGNITKDIKKGNWEPMDIKEAHTILQQPYEQELGDYQNKLKVEQQGATLERQTNVDKALAAQRRATAASIPAKLGQAQEKIDIQKFSAESQDWARKHPNAVQLKTKGGNVLLMDPKTQEVIDTGYEQGTLTDDETLSKKAATAAGLEEIRQNGRAALEKQRQGGRLSLQEQKHIDDMDKVEKEIQGRKDVRAVVPGGSKATSQIPSQQKVGQQLRANKLKQEHPEWADHVHIDPDGFVQVDPASEPGRFYGAGFPAAERQKVLDYLGQGVPPDTPTGPSSLQAPGYTPPKYTPPSNIPANGAPAGPTRPAGSGSESGYVPPGYTRVYDANNRPQSVVPKADAANQKTGKIRVKAPDGKTGFWDLSKGPVPKGYAVQ